MPLFPSSAPLASSTFSKDIVTTDTPDTGVPADSDAGLTARHESPSHHTDPHRTDPHRTDPHRTDPHRTDPRSDAPESPNAVDPSKAATEHLRRLWLAGARNLTVTYDADVERHRGYLSHPRTDI